MADNNSLSLLTAQDVDMETSAAATGGSSTPDSGFGALAQAVETLTLQPEPFVQAVVFRPDPHGLWCQDRDLLSFCWRDTEALNYRMHLYNLQRCTEDAAQRATAQQTRPMPVFQETRLGSHGREHRQLRPAHDSFALPTYARLVVQGVVLPWAQLPLSLYQGELHISLAALFWDHAVAQSSFGPGFIARYGFQDLTQTLLSIVYDADGNLWGRSHSVIGESTIYVAETSARFDHFPGFTKAEREASPGVGAAAYNYASLADKTKMHHVMEAVLRATGDLELAARACIIVVPLVANDTGANTRATSASTELWRLPLVLEIMPANALMEIAELNAIKFFSHQQQPNAVAEADKVPCPIFGCPSFPKRLSRHLTQMHPELCTFPCLHCGCPLYNAKMLQHHEPQCKGADSCTLCKQRRKKAAGHVPTAV